MCKTLQVEHKLFYFDLKENPRGRYLKISEKTSATRSTIIVPSSGISWFLDLFNYYVNSDDQDLFSKELQLDTKAFSIFILFSILFFSFLSFNCRIMNVNYRNQAPFLSEKYNILPSKVRGTCITSADLDALSLRTVNRVMQIQWKLVGLGVTYVSSKSNIVTEQNGKELSGSLSLSMSSDTFLEDQAVHVDIKHPVAWSTNSSLPKGRQGAKFDTSSALTALMNIYIQVSEASVSRNRSTIIVPAGSARNEEGSHLPTFPPPVSWVQKQQNSESSERLVGLSDDVGAGFISGHNSQPASASELNVDRSVELTAQEEIGNMGVSKVIRADQKKFFFDLGSNNRGFG
ncbi:hypothetical protein GH714_027780 [Hevea brasiliensis]|uniref:Uncharacterized protein n=1 Tax=Hevea brasiliensis TaxID=3981 RepID=A0A6A6MNM1_HEVBR|nr:hypothetical protein GH714_027780 [Hevea brasiliensis]